MAGVYSTRFLLESSTGADSWSTVVPPDEVWILRDIDAIAAADSTQIAVQVAGVYIITLFTSAAPSGDSGHAQWTGRQVINAGETLTVAVSGEAGVCVSGYSLTAP